jgi:FMN phosphatase YigB (HAD superfamily)
VAALRRRDSGSEDFSSPRVWTRAILSNNVPGLRLEDRFLRLFNSAEIGYEKPHQRAYDGVLETVTGAEAA